MKMTLAGKKLLILGGTRISCEIIEYAKRMGIITAVADYNAVEDSPGKQIADEHYLVSVTDVDAVVNLIKREKLDGVITGFSDMLLPYYADICAKAGLPSYGTKKQFEIFTNKREYKALCRAYGIPTVKEYQVNKEDLEEEVIDIQFPVLVKPVDSSGSRGISVCNNSSELKIAYQKVEEWSKTGKVLVEEYLTGKELTVFWIFQEGEYYLSMIGNRHVKKNQDGVIPLPAGYTFPSSITEMYLEQYVPKVRAMLRAVGIQDGMMFMQCKLEKDQSIVYDIGYRLTGSLEYKILDALCGYNPLEMLIHHALTGKMAEDYISKKVNPYLGEYAYNISFLGRPGTIHEINGIEQTKQVPGVLDSVVAHCSGETITEEMKGLLSQICLRVLGIAPNTTEMFKRIQQIQNLVNIVSEEGKDMLLSGLVQEDMEDVVIFRGYYLNRVYIVAGGPGNLRYAA